MPQRRPGNFLVGDVKNQPTILDWRSLRFANRRDVEERLKRAPVSRVRRRRDPRALSSIEADSAHA